MKLRLLNILYTVLISSSISNANAATIPVDIIFAIDTSSSMSSEISELQNGFNGFAENLSTQNIDARFIIIANNSICIPAPTGSGTCPLDESLPTYQHVNATVDSQNTLNMITNTYSQWSGSLRTNAEKEIVVFTDNNSSLQASVFDSNLLALDSSFQDYDFYGFIAASTAPLFPPSRCTSITIGAEYQTLASLTGGTIFDVCAGNVSNDLQFELSLAISANTVPVPAAVWLFGSGLLGMISILRRKNPA